MKSTKVNAIHARCFNQANEHHHETIIHNTGVTGGKGVDSESKKITIHDPPIAESRDDYALCHHPATK